MEYTQDVLRRSQDVPRRPQDAPIRPMAVQEVPKTPPRHPQDAARRLQEWKFRVRFGIEKRFPAEPPPDLDFGASWARFWELLGSIFEAFSEIFAEHWGAFAIQDRFENLPSASLQKERRFPFHVKSGFCWSGFEILLAY